MLHKLWFQALSISRRDFALLFTLLFNTITWYFMALMWIDSSFTRLALESSGPLVLIVFNASIILAGLVGSIFSGKISRFRLISSWMLLGAVVSWFPVLVNSDIGTHIVALSSILGISFGLGLPSCFSYFADNTMIENRGTLGGVILLVSNFCTIPIAFSFIVLDFDLVVISLISGFWRLIGLILFVSLKPREKVVSEVEGSASAATVPSGKALLLYVLPWLMFSLVNGLEEPVVARSLGVELMKNMMLVAPLIGGVSAFIGGFFADRMGRKRVVVIGFVTLGIAYAVLGLASHEIAQYLYGVVDASAGGIFLLLFFLVLWGDLSEASSKEKYYMIGIAFNYSTFIIRQVSIPYMGLVSPSAAFSLAAFFLFLAVLPLMYAPETLPEKKLELMHLRRYIEKAKRAKDKYVQVT